MAWVLPPKPAPPTVSMMLFVIRAPSLAVLTRIPVAWLGLVSEKPSTVTLTAWIVIIPVTVDSPNANVRPATGFPACAPLTVRILLITTFSRYPPAATLIVSPDMALLMANWIVLQAPGPGVEPQVLVSVPSVPSTYHV